jgi:selenocysteine lyase/cysteine desulfurase
MGGKKCYWVLIHGTMKNQRSKFSLPSGVTYLNCAYMSPLLKAVEKAGIEGIRKKRDPSSISSQDFFTQGDALRKEFAKLIHTDEPSRIVIVPSVSYGLASVAKNISLQSGEKIVLAHEQFPSNHYPWQRLATEAKAILHTVHPPETMAARGRLWNERIVEAIKPGTRIVAIGPVHWADGTKFDLVRIGKQARDVGAKLIIDGTQSVGALPFDIKKIQPDALVCGGYKWLMGPYAIGLAYYGPYFDQGVPIEENWINRLNSEDFAGLVRYESRYQPGSLRYEVGEHSNFILVPMMLEALKQINAWGPENIQAHCQAITKKGVRKLVDNGFWVEEDGFRCQHLFGIGLPKDLTVSILKERVMKKKISVSLRGNFMRISPNVYNDAHDVDLLVRALLNQA